MEKTDYRQRPTASLKAEYEALRRRVSDSMKEGTAPEGLIADLRALRDEIDRRESKPVVDIDFEKYITK